MKTVNIYMITVFLKNNGRMTYLSLFPFAYSEEKGKGYEGKDDGGIAYVLPEAYDYIETPKGYRYIGRPLNSEKSLYSELTLTKIDDKPTLIDYHGKTQFIPLEKAVA